jgi:hypothetical protein
MLTQAQHYHRSRNDIDKHFEQTLVCHLAWPIVFKHIGSVFVTPAGIGRALGLAADLAAFFAAASNLGWKRSSSQINKQQTTKQTNKMD